MLRSEVRAIALDYLDDPQAGYFSTARVNSWINFAQQDVQKLLIESAEMYYLKSVETTLVVGQEDYVLPDDFLKLHRLEVVVSGLGTVNEELYSIKEITFNQQDFSTRGYNSSSGTGTPTVYVIKRDRLKLIPAPDTAYTLRLHYSYTIADLTDDSQSVDVPNNYMDLVAIYTAKRGFVKDDRMPQNILDLENRYMDMLKKNSEDRTQDSPRQVVVTGEY